MAPKHSPSAQSKSKAAEEAQAERAPSAKSTEALNSDDHIEWEIEVERKYAVSKRARIPDFSELGPVSPARFDLLVAEYFDTPHLDLLHAARTLRRRTGGEDSGWHLKMADGGDARNELQVSLERGRRIPTELRAAVADTVGDAPLLPVASIRTERTTRSLFGETGAARATLFVDRVEADVLIAHIDEYATWTEVEVELAPGEPTETFDVIETLLAESGILRAASPSKLARLLDDVEPATKKNKTATELAIAAMADHLGRLQQLEGDVVRDAPDAVHQARVALRRMRSILQVYRKVFDPDQAGRLRTELRWAGEQLGGPRDSEVIREQFLAALENLKSKKIVGPVRERIVSTLAVRHDSKFAELLTAMATPRWDAMFARASTFITEAPTTRRGRQPGKVTLRQLADKSVKRVAERHERALRHPDELEYWHDVRKATKGARYAYEVLSGAYAEQRYAMWKKVASAFGEVQDTVIFEEQLSQFEESARAAGEPLDTYALLRSGVDSQRADALARAKDLVAKALDA